ncbi:MAG: acyltransferase family protein [Aliihoeflea sp.]|uniref:acyltransferase family protein n=1 Tax=Aliihoeflea sp. TaxID=2608088 RepID=UPI004034D132
MHASRYRKDIDGLRAIAVLLVTVFHINETLIPGGYVGVDVFFVISGYLITGIIVRDVDQNRFSFAEFYRRRFRRIFPAMFAVTLTTLVVGILVMLPEDVQQLAWSAIATSLSGANVFFTYFLDTSYFAADSAAVPLLHMWSLGVEEQFYLVWPLALLLMLKTRKTLALLVLVVVGSIAIGEWQLRNGLFEWAYYMLPSRAFQLAVGGALVFLPAVSFLAARLLMPLGLAAVIGSAWLLDAASAFPGFNAVPVTLGTAAILASGGLPTAWSRCLSIQPLRLVGLISYSLYLWHWPVLAFQRYFVGELSAQAQVTSFVVMILLAIASYRLVELPCRHSTLTLRAVAVRFAVMPTAATVAIAYLMISVNGHVPWISPEDDKRLATFQPASDADYVCQAGRLRDVVPKLRRCLVNAEREPSVLMWGDSNAGHYVGVIRELALHEGFGFRNIAHASCPPLLGGAEDFVTNRVRETCASSSQLVQAMLSAYSGIIISASWDTYLAQGGAGFLEAFEASLRQLVGAGKSVIVIGRVPRLPSFDPECVRKQQKLPLLSCDASADRQQTDRINSQVRDAAVKAGAAYIDFTDLLCKDGLCTDRINGETVYYDPGHISMSGAEALGRLAVAKGIIFPGLN